VKRREFIAGLGSAAAWPAVARAQQPAMPVIGLLGPESGDEDYKNFTIPFLQGLKETGYAEGQNVAIQYRYGESTQSATGACSRSRPPPCRCDRSKRRRGGAGGEGSDLNHTHRLFHRR
jgi:hypothetical protein